METNHPTHPCNNLSSTLHNWCQCIKLIDNQKQAALPEKEVRILKDKVDQLQHPYLEKKDPSSSHAIIQGWLRKFQPGTRVLDVGTATGILGKNLADSGLYLKGIEPKQEWVEEARPYYDEILCIDLENTPEEYLIKHDVVVFADVLEHLPDPEKVLKNLVSLQKPDTQFIISIPNIANIWIRLNLLFGKFNYSDFGILDRTHLRFFTKTSFMELLYSSRLIPLEIRYTPIPMDLVSDFFSKSPVGLVIFRIFSFFASCLPGLFAYQFVARSILVEGEK